MSIHKNYIEWYWRNRNKICTEKLLPHQKEIFNLFSEKFYIDAEKDWERGRRLLKALWNKCSESYKEIHIILNWNENFDNKIKDLINNIVNLDYNSLFEIFQALKDEYTKAENQEITEEIESICRYLKKMWNISCPHTTIQKE